MTREETIERLFKESYKELYLHALSFVRDEAEAEDIVNDVFAYLWDNYSRIDFSTSVRAFLYKLVRNRGLDVLRHGKAVNRFRDYQLHFTVESDEGDERDHEELIAKVMGLIESMPPQTRHVFQACFVEYKKYKEVADELNISVNTVKTHISKALRILRQQFPDSMSLILTLFMKINVE